MTLISDPSTTHDVDTTLPSIEPDGSRIPRLDSSVTVFLLGVVLVLAANPDSAVWDGDFSGPVGGGVFSWLFPGRIAGGLPERGRVLSCVELVNDDVDRSAHVFVADRCGRDCVLRACR